MKVIFALFFVVLTAEGIASAAPQKYETAVQTTQDVVATQPHTPDVTSTPDAPRQVQPEETTSTVEPERPPEPIMETVVTHPQGCEQYRQLISQYDWNVDVALKVMRAESGCNPNAIGDNRVIGGIYAPSCGLFQIRTLQGRPSCDQLQNPTTNVEWAIKLYRASGWKPWSVCNTGKVSCL